MGEETWGPTWKVLLFVVLQERTLLKILGLQHYHKLQHVTSV